ncbi:hypothetical protein KHQ06_28240 [Nocardia tengchongensis]|uniref:Lipoprotein n=1 Tax=Nocardia tengchongensis TaxID=2055889 RepID=A0ABX8CKM3_9NOCA|nr:hypothetical protein [Nocardia tengchongensis]QVI20114.1 hypothetical protein KHQ06_28240 [Nocardia tengchongensis]
MPATRIPILLALTVVAAAGCSSGGGTETPPASLTGRTFVSTRCRARRFRVAGR